MSNNKMNMHSTVWIDFYFSEMLLFIL